jgi:rhodanese-related sulfurtransferase
MTASWLAQMNWEVHVLDGLAAGDFAETGVPAAALPPAPAAATVSPARLARWLGLAGSARADAAADADADADDAAPSPPGEIVLIDLAASAAYVKAHLPGAWFALRSQLPEALAAIHAAQPAPARYVLTSPDGALARYAAADLAPWVQPESVRVLEGGSSAWLAAGLPMEAGEQRLASPRIDRYRRPYEGTDNPVEAMQGYLDWEFGLVEQLGRDGTHGFFVI